MITGVHTGRNSRLCWSSIYEPIVALPAAKEIRLSAEQVGKVIHGSLMSSEANSYILGQARKVLVVNQMRNKLLAFVENDLALSHASSLTQSHCVTAGVSLDKLKRMVTCQKQYFCPYCAYRSLYSILQSLDEVPEKLETVFSIRAGYYGYPYPSKCELTCLSNILSNVRRNCRGSILWKLFKQPKFYENENTWAVDTCMVGFSAQRREAASLPDEMLLKKLGMGDSTWVSHTRSDINSYVADFRRYPTEVFDRTSLEAVWVRGLGGEIRNYY